MKTEYLIIIYLWMAIVYGCAAWLSGPSEDYSWVTQIVGSIFLGLLWPVILPAHLIKKFVFD